MKIYISSFYNVRFFTENIIPISTAGGYGWPWWLFKADNQKIGTYYINKNNVMIGIKEDSLSYNADEFCNLTEPCQKNCPYISKAPHCQFMDSYYNQLTKLNFKELIDSFNYIAEDIRTITHYKGEPIIVLLVYESAKVNCAERPCLQKWFKDNNYDLLEWSKDLIMKGDYNGSN